ncbi:MAG TPA: hypothetical protein VGG64_11735 [Pirellulales bacterium]|jgi:hypothetical protein|nr:hypothetical protein [Pirellulales bacterium]
MLKLNVGFNRKVGESNYGSRGASVNLELELESGLIGDPDKLKDRIRQLFTLAKTSVDEELAGNTSSNHGTGNGNTSQPANGSGQRRNNGRHATASQVRALHAIAGREQLDLAAVLAERFNVSQADDLSINEASELIDSLKAQSNSSGTGGRR